MIGGYVQHNHVKDAMEVFIEGVQPKNMTHLSMLKANWGKEIHARRARALEWVKEVHSQIFWKPIYSFSKSGDLKSKALTWNISWEL